MSEQEFKKCKLWGTSMSCLLKQLLWQQSWSYNLFVCQIIQRLQSHILFDSQSFYRAPCNNSLNKVNSQFTERSDQAGLHKLQQLENVLIF